MNYSQKYLNRLYDEYQTSARNKRDADEEYEAFIGLLDSDRGEKNYDWMSDVRLPEFASHMLTQSSIDVDQYFQTRDFVEVYTEDEGDEAKGNAEAAKELINRTLNQKHLSHYLKYVRAKNINHLNGFVYALCWWEYEEKVDKVGTTLVSVPTSDGIDIQERDIVGQVVIKDRFNYEPLDPRNVFTDNRYVYSLQDKDFIILRSEKSLESLREMDIYDVPDDLSPPAETQTSKETYNKDDNHEVKNNEMVDVLDRYGKEWCIVLERDSLGWPTKIEPGYGDDGKKLDKAELCEAIATFIVSDSKKHLIGFRPTWARDAYGMTYKPIIRGLCYVHPDKDHGAGDGKYARELQIAIDDTFNMSNDRVQLATMPVMKGKRHSIEDNSTIFWQPGHTIELNDTEDLKEMKIEDNVQGALNQLAILTGKMDQVTSIFPTTMGSPGQASTSATAIAGAENRTNIRTNYKSMTFEYTFLTELYWMIQHMTYVFAKPDTGMKLMGEKVYNFHPGRDYYYKPVSQSIETEQSKRSKIQMLTQVLGYVTQIQHPDAINIVNYITEKMFGLMGDEIVNITKTKLDPRKQIEGAGQLPALQNPTSNQSGIPQSGMEQSTREMSGGLFG